MLFSVHSLKVIKLKKKEQIPRKTGHWKMTAVTRPQFKSAAAIIMYLSTFSVPEGNKESPSVTLGDLQLFWIVSVITHILQHPTKWKHSRNKMQNNDYKNGLKDNETSVMTKQLPKCEKKYVSKRFKSYWLEIRLNILHTECTSWIHTYTHSLNCVCWDMEHIYLSQVKLFFTYARLHNSGLK